MDAYPKKIYPTIFYKVARTIKQKTHAHLCDIGHRFSISEDAQQEGSLSRDTLALSVAGEWLVCLPSFVIHISLTITSFSFVDDRIHSTQHKREKRLIIMTTATHNFDITHSISL